MRSSLLACVAVLGCYDDPPPPSGTPDAPGPDAAPDAPVDAAPVDVRVRVSHPTPAGYTVLFYGPDHQLVARTTTDAAGLAVAALPQGGTVLVVTDPVMGSIDELRAIFGVEPGDELHIGPVIDEPPTEPHPSGGDTMAMTVPSRPGASIYRVGTRCGIGGAGATSMTLFLEAGCQGALAALAVAQDGSQQLLAAQRGTVTGGAGSGALSGAWLDPEAATMSIMAGADAVGAYSLLAPWVEGHWMPALGFESHVPIAAGATGTLSWPTAPASTVDARLFRVVFSRTAVPGSFQRFMRIHPPFQAAFQFDIAAEQLPWYSPAVVNSYDVATRKASLARSSGAALDGQLVRIQFEDEFSFPGAWNCVIPPDWTEVTLPVLPADLARFDPSAPQLDTRQVAPTAVSSSVYPGYAEFRRGTPQPLAIGSSYNVTAIPVSPL